MLEKVCTIYQRMSFFVIEVNIFFRWLKTKFSFDEVHHRLQKPSRGDSLANELRFLSLTLT